MFMSFRVTRRWVVNVFVAAILARLFFMGMDGFDQFSSDWNRVTGAAMPGSGGARGVVADIRSTLPGELDDFVARAQANADHSRSLLDVLKSVAGMADPSTPPDQPLPYGTLEQMESPYDRYAD